MPSNPTLEILYDDGPCLVVNKRSGLLTQAPAGIDSLEVQVKNFYRQREGKLAHTKIYLGLPHRLDRPVSGAIVLARHVRAARKLSAQFENRSVDKVYWALVEGHVDPLEGTWTDTLLKQHGKAQVAVVDSAHPAGKKAVLHYRVRRHGPIDSPRTGSEPGVSWLEIHLETGRTHQIRVQAAARGHAILGDWQYGSQVPFGPQYEDRRERAIALHARQLAFRHPMTQMRLDIRAPLPPVWPGLEAA